MFKINKYLDFLPKENIKINEYAISSIGQNCINIQYNNNIFLFENVVTSYKFMYTLLTPNYFRMKREVNNNKPAFYYLPYIHNYNKTCIHDIEIVFRGNDTYASLKKVKNDFNLQTIDESCIIYIRRLIYNSQLQASTIIVPWVDTPTLPLYQILLQSLACGYVKKVIFDLTHSNKSSSFSELYEMINLLHISTSVSNNYLYCNLNIYNFSLFNKILNFPHTTYWYNILNNNITTYNNLSEFIQEEVNI